MAGREGEENDGEAIFGLLAEASASGPALDARGCILDALRSIQGPFAFAYFGKPSQTLFFAHDRLGRRSLVFYQDEASDTCILSSVPESCLEGSRDRWRLPPASWATLGIPLATSRNDWQADSRGGD
ncbi:hypothetical protein GGS24DRAFT_130495 [Hypoxylon argillaceum]|nr:hypothetical protein GGS24DRAFT_130495 [Hypoxylon argillaceum]